MENCHEKDFNPAFCLFFIAADLSAAASAIKTNDYCWLGMEIAFESFSTRGEEMAVRRPQLVKYVMFTTHQFFKFTAPIFEKDHQQSHSSTKPRRHSE